MDVLASFGVDWVMLVAQIVNFLVIAWLINRFLLRPLMENLKERRRKIALGLENAERADRLMADAARERDTLLQKASAEAFRLLENARQEAERLRGAALEKAAGDADRIVAEARGNIALERQAMEREVQGLSLELSGRILETAVQGLFTDAEKALVVARGLERIGKAGRN